MKPHTTHKLKCTKFLNVDGKQECIPVGCVSPAAVAVGGGVYLLGGASFLGGSPCREVSLPEGVSCQGVSLPGGSPCLGVSLLGGLPTRGGLPARGVSLHVSLPVGVPPSQGSPSKETPPLWTDRHL